MKKVALGNKTAHRANDRHKSFLDGNKSKAPEEEEQFNEANDMFQNVREVEKLRIEDDLKSLHMFSTSTTMNKI